MCFIFLHLDLFKMKSSNGENDENCDPHKSSDNSKPLDDQSLFRAIKDDRIDVAWLIVKNANNSQSAK